MKLVFKILGIQLRSDYLYKEDFQVFMNCARQIEIELKTESNNSRPVKWYVSSEYEWVIDEIRNMTASEGDKIISGEGKIDHVIKDPNAYERAILDVELLSRCDRLILTGGSSFGFVAAFKNRRRPYYVNGRRSAQKCVLFDFSEPSRRPSDPTVF